ncbi:MAG: calcium-binding protein [Anaerolineae bacterium]|nr:calcium-binding protein [Anaerolineae bacterium]
MEIIVDANGPEECSMGWFYYLADTMRFPFKAKCIKPLHVSLLKEGEEVEVIDMAPGDDCENDMLVMVKWQDRTFGVPLEQLEGIDVDEDTQQAIEDWHYWVEQGYEF